MYDGQTENKKDTLEGDMLNYIIDILYVKAISVFFTGIYQINFLPK